MAFYLGTWVTRRQHRSAELAVSALLVTRLGMRAPRKANGQLGRGMRICLSGLDRGRQ